MSDAVTPRKRSGAPAWMVTFGDLMALLLTFFVLILSFSNMDEGKYGQVAEAMEAALGEGYKPEQSPLAGAAGATPRSGCRRQPNKTRWSPVSPTPWPRRSAIRVWT